MESHYAWEPGGPLPSLQRHSAVKHELLRDYLVEYLLTLVSSPQQDCIRLTIVDGFCGGGLYRDGTGGIVKGSPLVILDALKEAKARITIAQKRKKPIQFDVVLICIDKVKKALEHLDQALKDDGYGRMIEEGSIQFLVGDFRDHAPAVIECAGLRSPRSGKAIFVLDQYGYSQVPQDLLREIFFRLGKAEVILTFNVDSLINYLNEKNLSGFEKKTGFDCSMTAAELDSLRQSPHWRKEIQLRLSSRIRDAVGAEFFTLFFIRPERGHGDFWLLHLSRHAKARDVMTSVHWNHSNHFVHYGSGGLDMFNLGYAAKIDDYGKAQQSFQFDDAAALESHTLMMQDIPNFLAKHPNGIPFGVFFQSVCNKTPATRIMIEKAMIDLARQGDVEILGEDGGKRNVRASIQNDHVLRLQRQQRIIFWS